jgi:hypothetical protein
MEDLLLTIDECGEDELPVLLHQVVDVTKDTAVTQSQPLFAPLALRGSCTYHMAQERCGGRRVGGRN